MRREGIVEHIEVFRELLSGAKQSWIMFELAFEQRAEPLFAVGIAGA